MERILEICKGSERRREETVDKFYRLMELHASELKDSLRGLKYINEHGIRVKLACLEGHHSSKCWRAHQPCQLKALYIIHPTPIDSRYVKCSSDMSHLCGEGIGTATEALERFIKVYCSDILPQITNHIDKFSSKYSLYYSRYLCYDQIGLELKSLTM